MIDEILNLELELRDFSFFDLIKVDIKKSPYKKESSHFENAYKNIKEIYSKLPEGATLTTRQLLNNLRRRGFNTRNGTNKPIALIVAVINYMYEKPEFRKHKISMMSKTPVV